MISVTRSAQLLLACVTLCVTTPTAAQVTAIRAGRLVDPETGTTSTNQIILIEDGRFSAIGANVLVPRDASVIDLSELTVLPGLVDAHNHLSLIHI